MNDVERQFNNAVITASQSAKRETGSDAERDIARARLASYGYEAQT